MRECVCNECGMEFTIERLDIDKDTMKDGNEVEVISFTCPKCDEKFIVAVRDEESARLQGNLQSAQEKYRKSGDTKDENKMRQLRNEVKIENSYPILEDESEEKSTDMAEINTKVRSRKSYLKKWYGLSDEDVEDELSQIAREQQLLEQDNFMPNMEQDETVPAEEGEEV